MTSEDIFGDHAPGRINEIGDFATCGCGLPIQYNGDGWEHLNGKGYPHLPRPEKPLTDADRIAAAVAVLHEANKDADIIEELSRSRGTDPTTLILRLFGAGINLSELSAKALAILEGRAET